MMAGRLITLYTIYACLFVAAWFHGIPQLLFYGDKSFVSYGIATIAVVSMVVAFFTGKHMVRTAWLCEALGFGGTLIGITMGLSTDADLASTEGIIAAGNALYGGMGTAFYSTLVGLCGMLMIWIAAQIRGEDV